MAWSFVNSASFEVSAIDDGIDGWSLAASTEPPLALNIDIVVSNVAKGRRRFDDGRANRFA